MGYGFFMLCEVTKAITHGFFMLRDVEKATAHGFFMLRKIIKAIAHGFFMLRKTTKAIAHGFFLLRRTTKAMTDGFHGVAALFDDVCDVAHVPGDEVFLSNSADSLTQGCIRQTLDVIDDRQLAMS